MGKKSKYKRQAGWLKVGDVTKFIVGSRAYERNFTRGYEDWYRASWLLGSSPKLVYLVCI